MSLRPAWLTFRRYAATTTGMTLVLFALGVYTAATGSGTGVSGPVAALLRPVHPRDDDQPGLHRVVPPRVGDGHRVPHHRRRRLDVVRGSDRRTRLAATLAVAILPLQITVGALTVTLGGLVPGGYTVSTHAAHLIVALAIFTLLGLATIWGGGRGSPRLLRAAIGVAAVGIVASAVFSGRFPSSPTHRARRRAST